VCLNASAATLTVTSINDGPNLTSPLDIVLDVANGRVLVVDSGLDAVVAVELTSGDHVIVSSGP